MVKNHSLYLYWKTPHTINFNYQLDEVFCSSLSIHTYLPFKNTFLDIYIIILLQMEMLAPFHPYFLDFMEWKDTSSASFQKKKSVSRFVVKSKHSQKVKIFRACFYNTSMKILLLMQNDFWFSLKATISFFKENENFVLTSSKNCFGITVNNT